MSATAAAKAKAAPGDARTAARAGFDFGAAGSTITDTWTGPSALTREGTMEVCDDQGGKLEVPFVAKIVFGKPRAIKS
jgi:hypothetical protein